MARIVTVYPRDPTREDRRRCDIAPVSMAYIRWFKIAEQLAALGHEVDIAVPDAAIEWPATAKRSVDTGLRRVALSKIDWGDYDVVKTVFHRGFDTLEEYGGSGHPFIISKLGSVVGPRDMDGIYFYGEMRESLYATQRKIDRASRYVTLLSPQARALWHECFGASDNTLLVPGAVDSELPARARDPYPALPGKRVLFAGNIYTASAQPEANRTLVDKLNRLGGALARSGARLYMLGSGDVTRLDATYVSYLGSVDYVESWDYLRHADVGVVVAAGPFNHNNESTKIYHYLRVGLPVVSEAGFPNDDVITESRLGYVVESGNMEALAERTLEAAHRSWDRESAIRYIVERHTWEKRVLAYAPLLMNGFARLAT